MKNKLILLTASAILIGCSSGPVVQKFPETASATGEVSKLNTDLEEAKRNQVNVLAPKSFDNAMSSFQEAKDGVNDHDDAADILEDAAKSRAYLDQAMKFADLSRSNLKEVVVARQEAVDAKAPTHFNSEFKDADEDLTDVTADIEKNDLAGAAKNKQALQLKYLDLELRSIKKEKLGPARATVEKAMREGAKEFAPRSLALAEKTISDSDAFITANRHETVAVDENANKATMSADHLLKITQNAKTGDKTSPEDMALKMESEQNKVSAKQAMVDARTAQLQATQGALSEEKSNVSALAAQNAALGTEQAFNKKFEETQKEFDPKEAEVYKQGNTLVIRLRTLNFTKDQASLKASNFALLAKVNKAIQGFGESSVIVEGHTDSQGGKALNDKLSTERANSVREYLLSTAEYEPTAVKAVGFGYEKPLASNKTAEGRAQNRRVDIVIQPSTM